MAIDVKGKEITLNADAVLDSNKVVTAPTGYIFKIGGTITKCEEKTESGIMTGGIFSYASSGNTIGYRVVEGEIKHFTNNRKIFTINGLIQMLNLAKIFQLTALKLKFPKRHLHKVKPHLQQATALQWNRTA